MVWENPFKSSRLEVFCKKCVLKVSVKFIGRYLFEQKGDFIKKEIVAREFSFEFCAIFKNTFFHRIPALNGTLILQTVVLLMGAFNLEILKKVMEVLPFNKT